MDQGINSFRSFNFPLVTMTILSLYIINKAGGLVYQKDYSDLIQKLNSNDYLILAGTFHGIHAITSRLSPLSSSSSGISLLQGDQFNISCHQTPTAIKFLLVFIPSNNLNINVVHQKVYEIYADYAMKNPFYTPEMPIVRCDLFDNALIKAVLSFNSE